MLVGPAFLLAAVRPTPFIATSRPTDLDVASVTNLYVSTFDGWPRDGGLPVASSGARPEGQKHRRDTHFRALHC